MITSTMNKTELLNELRRIHDWISLRQPGIVQKYSKQLKLPITQDRMLGISKYATPDNNKIHVVWSVTSWGVTQIRFAWYAELQTSNGMSYVRPNYDVDGTQIISVCVYSAHAIQRLKERQGVGFREMIEREYTESQGTLCTLPYTYKGKETLATPFGTLGLWITTASNWGKTFVTYISLDQCGVEQSQSIYDARKVIDSCRADEVAYYNDKASEIYPKLSRWQRRHSIIV